MSRLLTAAMVIMMVIGAFAYARGERISTGETRSPVSLLRRLSRHSLLKSPRCMRGCELWRGAKRQTRTLFLR
jgi:hypothetical protein